MTLLPKEEAVGFGLFPFFAEKKKKKKKTALEMQSVSGCSSSI